MSDLQLYQNFDNFPEDLQLEIQKQIYTKNLPKIKIQSL